jgi:multidrug resistance efflux pump
MQIAVRVTLTLVLLFAAVFLCYDMVSYYLYSPWTRDARVRADVVSVAPDVSGYVEDIRVHDDQFVHKGDVLFVVDQERYRIALADAEAGLEARRAQHLMVRAQYERRSRLSPGVAISAEELENVQRQADTADANYQQAVATRDNAALNLKRTEIRAPVNGFITNLNLAKGTYVSQAKAVMALIDSDSYRVAAYFEETKIPHIRPGAAVEIHLMDGAPALRGTVVGISRGITDQDNRNGPELLSSINPTFTWVRLAQRIPVRIRFDGVPPNVFISAGMTCTVIMKEGAAPTIGLGIKKIMMAIF